MAQYATSQKSGNYASSNNQSSYTSSSSTSYQPLNNATKTSLQVIQWQVKEETQGVCTCQKKVACRGTCRT